MRVPGNTKPERLARLRSVGCPAHLLVEADATLKLWVTPVHVAGRWKVMAHLSDVTARRAVRSAARAGRRGGA